MPFQSFKTANRAAPKASPLVAARANPFPHNGEQDHALPPPLRRPLRLARRPASDPRILHHSQTAQRYPPSGKVPPKPAKTLRRPAPPLSLPAVNSHPIMALQSLEEPDSPRAEPRVFRTLTSAAPKLSRQQPRPALQVQRPE
jgi:hypothetical protein